MIVHKDPSFDACCAIEKMAASIALRSAGDFVLFKHRSAHLSQDDGNAFDAMVQHKVSESLAYLHSIVY